MIFELRFEKQVSASQTNKSCTLYRAICVWRCFDLRQVEQGKKKKHEYKCTDSKSQKIFHAMARFTHVGLSRRLRSCGRVQRRLCHVEWLLITHCFFYFWPHKRGGMAEQLQLDCLLSVCYIPKNFTMLHFTPATIRWRIKTVTPAP